MVRDYPNNGREFLLPFLRLEPDGRRTQDSEVTDRIGMRRALVRNGTKLIAGHGSYQRLAWLVPAERTIVFFREPVQQVVSQYEHNSRVRLERGQAPMPYTLLEWARREEWRNVQTRTTGGLIWLPPSSGSLSATSSLLPRSMRGSGSPSRPAPAM